MYTASRFKASVYIILKLPSKSLIKAICYPESVTFTSKATKWGYDHEKTAREVYLESIADYHTDLTVSDSGLVIHPDSPHLGASPNGIVNCSCCGAGVIEVKCPFSCTDRSDAIKALLKLAAKARTLDQRHVCRLIVISFRGE